MTTPKGNCLAGGTSIVESRVRRSSAITPNETDDGSLIRKVTICKANHKSHLFRRQERSISSKRLNKKDEGGNCLPRCVGVTGLEPATSRPPDVCANQLRYTPNTGAYFRKRVQMYGNFRLPQTFFGLFCCFHCIFHNNSSFLISIFCRTFAA